MIFVILGTQKFQFNRILVEIDKLIEDGTIKEPVIAQIGYSTYEPKHFQYHKFLDKKDYEKILDQADLVICHGGTGAIINSITKEKKVIALPRLSEFNEHVDNHQLEIVSIFHEFEYVEMVLEMEKLKDCINNIANKEFKKYESNTSEIINTIDLFIKRNFEV